MNKNIEETRKNMDSLVDRTSDAVGVAADRAEQSVMTAADSVVDKAHGATDFLRDKLETATNDAHRRLNETAKAFDRGYARAQTDLSRAAAAATGYISENPGKSLAFAASAGFVLGVLAHRHRANA